MSVLLDERDVMGIYGVHHTEAVLLLQEGSSSSVPQRVPRKNGSAVGAIVKRFALEPERDPGRCWEFESDHPGCVGDAFFLLALSCFTNCPVLRMTLRFSEESPTYDLVDC